MKTSLHVIVLYMRYKGIRIWDRSPPGRHPHKGPGHLPAPASAISKKKAIKPFFPLQNRAFGFFPAARQTLPKQKPAGNVHNLML